MPPEARKYLWDAPDAARRITRFTSGKSLKAFESDELLSESLPSAALDLRAGDALSLVDSPHKD